MIKRYAVKSCCGKSNYIFQTDLPVKKKHLVVFTGAGYTAPESYSQHGLFYIRGKGLTASASFGTTRISVRCGGADCAQKMDEFAELLEQALNG
jgi:hypothetical protein